MLLLLLLLFFFFIKGLIHVLSLEEFPPAVAQGALAVTCRADDETMIKLLEPLNHIPTLLCCTAERGLLRTLEGGCKVPIGKEEKKNNNNTTKKIAFCFVFHHKKKYSWDTALKNKGSKQIKKKMRLFGFRGMFTVVIVIYFFVVVFGNFKLKVCVVISKMRRMEMTMKVLFFFFCIFCLS